MHSYLTDLSDSQWQAIKKFLNVKRKRKYCLRSIFNAILYLTKTGCQWRLLPATFAKWQIVYYYFKVWSRAGIIEKLLQSLVRKTRKRQGRKPRPTAAVIDAQSVKSTLVSSREHTGFDGGKKIKGIKRHIVVDVMGNLLCVAVHAASVADRKGGQLVLSRLREKWPGIKMIYADGGYPLPGRAGEENQELCGYPMTVVRRPDLGTFKVVPKRWVVERSFAWIDTQRRNAKSYERLPQIAETITQLSAIRVMLNRL